MMKKKIYRLLFIFVCCWGLIMPAQANADTGAFKDVPSSYWGYKNIQRAYSEGVVSGTDYNEATGVRNFSPEDKLTMAQFATILARAFYADDLAASTAGNDPWYAATQEVCEKNGVTEGSSFYNAEVESSRYQMASFMYNVLKDKGVKLPGDAEIAAAQSKIADWNIISVRDQKAVATVFAMGLITGKDDAGNFCGNDFVTRAEAATVYCRLADAIAAGGAITTPSTPTTPVTPEPEPNPEPEKPAAGNYGAVGTLSDTPVTLSLSTHKPVVDYWSKAPADVQAITDKDMFNAAVQTIKDRYIEAFEEQGVAVKNNVYYNYACWDYSKVDDAIRKNISGALGSLSGYGSYGFVRNLNNADDNNLAIIAYSINNEHKAQLDAAFEPIFAQFKPGMTDKQKAEIMLKAVNDRFEYGPGNDLSWTDDSKLVGDCNCFANAVTEIFSAAGIPIDGSLGGQVYNGAHAWNCAYLDGEWWFVDATASEVGYDGIMTVAEHESIYKYKYVESDRAKIVKALVEAAYK